MKTNKKFQIELFRLLLTAYITEPMPKKLAWKAMSDSIPAQDWIGMNLKPEFFGVPTITILEGCYFMSEAALNDGSEVNFKELGERIGVNYEN